MRQLTALAGVLLAVVAVGCSQGGHSELERRKLALVRGDALLTITVPDATPGPIAGNAGHAGQFPTSARALRMWSLHGDPAAAFASAVRQAVALGMKVRTLSCGNSAVANGFKPVGPYLGNATIGVVQGPSSTLNVTLTVGGGPSPATTPIPSATPTIDQDCPRSLRDAVV
jgi:hypothetical protein